MPTFWSKTLIPTARQAPSDAVAPSHLLMLRAGLIRQLGAGVYDYLPLGLRALHKVIAVVRQEMDAAGGVEVLLPVLQPIELWRQTGRDQDYGDNLFVITDRHGRKQALGPTHEEVVTELMRAHVESYKQLPLTLYQIQNKFRDEFRPRFGVIRSREFIMKDAYSFDLTVEGLDRSYQAMYDAYCRIFERCGLPYRIVEAESGPIGGSASHEFMVPSPTGEDTILESNKGNYAANIEKCEIGERASSLDGAATGELQEVHTPDCSGIEDVCAFFKKKLGSKLKAENMLKTLVCQAEDKWVLAVVRGDHDLNEVKLRTVAEKQGFHNVTLVDEKQAREAGFVIGFVGPQVAVKQSGVTVFVDPDAAKTGFWVTGANEADHHIKHFNWKRDLLDPLGEQAKTRIFVADIRNAVEGDPSPKNDGGVLRETKGIEVGHVFKLGTKYAEALDFNVLGEDNQRHPVIMGCYGIGVNRILASAIEAQGGHDDNGITWPAGIAPYQVLIVAIKWQGAIKDTAEQLAKQLESQHFDVLIDDRDERPGVKFKDADLVGVPVRITIGDKGLKDGCVEVKARKADQADMVKIDGAAKHIVDLIKTL